MKFRRFSAFFLVGFFVLLTAVLLSSKPVSSDWTNDLDAPIPSVQIGCNDGTGRRIPLDTTTTNNSCTGGGAEIYPGCTDPLSGCSELKYKVDTQATRNVDFSDNCRTTANPTKVPAAFVEPPPPYIYISNDGSNTVHTVTITDAKDCAGNHTIKPLVFKFTFGNPGTTPTEPTLTPTPTSTAPTNTPAPTATPTSGVTPMAGVWFQGVGGDMRQDLASGFVDRMPTITPTPIYASIPGSALAPVPAVAPALIDRSQMPGILYSIVDPNFGGGKASIKEWLVKNSAYNSATLGRDTSYQTLLLRTNSATKKTLDTTCNQVGTGCDLTASFTSNGTGVYTTTTPSDIYIQGTNIPAGTYTLLVDGNITIVGTINLNPGAFLMISSSKSITVEGDINRMEGFYSADQNFTVQNFSPAQQLIIQGLVVANAGGGGNTFTTLRETAPNPSVLLIERPDLILSTPEYLRKQNYISQEVAP